MAKPENWSEMTPEQKRAWRLDNFLKSGEKIKFVSPQAKKDYNVRVKRLADVYNVRQPDRVPINIMAGNLPLTMAGLDTRTAFYEPRKAFAASMTFNEKYSHELELFSLPMAASGEALDILDYKLYVWPGHGLPDNAPGWQFVEGEYMTVDEYDDFIRDPSDFWLRKYLPRVFGAFEGFSLFQPFTTINENVHVNNLMPMSKPQVQEMFKKFLDAGKAFKRNNYGLFQYMSKGKAWGFPRAWGGFAKAPFDTLGDTLRGTTNIMKDMFRQPQKLLRALDVMADLQINHVLKSDGIDDTLIVMYPLHKGADGWMSQKAFETFYWPSLKKVMDALIAEGLIQQLFAEGSYNTRLDYVNQFPKGTVLWYFDRTDMANAKRILGRDCALMGNVPSSMIVTSTPADIKKYCKELIEVAGKNGGYVLAPGSSVENPRLENLKAMVEAVNEYGYY